MTAVSVLIIFVANFAQIILGEAPKSLKLVNLLYRHGDRTPIEGIPSLNDTDADWPPGFGQLTTLGMKQEYNLGKFIRDRYDGFLSKPYIRKEIYVTSTDVDRTLMSAQSVLSALYPPEGQQVWNDDIKWQPIPVHTTPRENDMLFAKASCEKLDQQRKKVAQKPEVFSRLRQKHGALLLDIVKKAGYPFDENDNSSYTLDNKVLRDLLGALKIRTINNRTLPEWATDEVMTKIRQDILPYLRYASTSDHIVRKYTGGPLLTKMVTDMKMRVDGILEPNMKMFMYSAHDVTVMWLLSALDIYDNSSIPYSTLATLELHQDQDTQQFYVQIWYKTDSTPRLMQIPGCDANCTFERFVNLTHSMMIQDRYRECVMYMSLGFTSYENKVIFLTLVGSVLLFFSLLFMGVLCHKKCGHGSRRTVKYRVHENTELPESLPMINSGGGLSDED